jgi:Xaa-Pro aminopeptidase
MSGDWHVQDIRVRAQWQWQWRWRWVGILVVVLGARANGQATPFPVEVPGATGLRGQPAEDYRTRCKALMAHIRQQEGLSTGSNSAQKHALVVIAGANPPQVADFEEQKFRQTNHFAYLCGFDEPGGVLVLDAGADITTLYVREHPGVASGFGEAHPELKADEETAERLGVDRLLGIDHLLGDLFTALRDPNPLAERDMGDAGRAVLYSDVAPNRIEREEPRTRLHRFLKEGAPTTPWKNVYPFLGELRKVKSATEIALLERAIGITGEAEHAAARKLRPGLFEFQIEGRILGIFSEYGAARPGFKSIVGSGPNSCIPHYFMNTRRMEAGDLVVVDIGAEYQNYTADITRTFPVGGTFSPRQRALYQLVLDAQAHAAGRFEVGKTRLAEMDGWARAFLRDSPLRAKDDSGAEQTMDRFFIHGLGHYLGMDVHDVGNGGQPMQPGEVFTIEPGLYIRSENIGIRIEDDYLVTKTGLRKLSEAIASTPDAVEAWMAEDDETAVPAVRAGR